MFMLYNNINKKRSNMATLLQQKNCLTALTNGAVNNNGSSSNANGSANNSAKDDTAKILVAATHHDIVTIPSSEEIVSGGGSGDDSNNSQQQHNHNSTDSYHQSFDLISNSNHHHTFNHFHHHHHHHIQPFTTRYFSQFSNQQETPSSSEFLYMSSTSSSSSSSKTVATINRASINHLSCILTNDNNLQQNRTSFIHEPPTVVASNLAAQQQTTSEEKIKSGDKAKMQEQTKTEEKFGAATTVVTDPQQLQSGEEQELEPEIDIVINNVVCSFSVRCHLNLREIALNGFNVEFRRENGMVTMKLRRPYTTASIWSSGRITCTGATSEEQAKIAARRYARCLQKLGFSVKFHNFRVVNVLGTCSMPWAIKIVNFSEKYKKEASYEPELHPGVTYKLKYPKATLKIFSTGSVTVTAGSVAHVQAAIEHIFPLVYEFRKKRSAEEIELLRSKHSTTTGEFSGNNDELLHSPPNAKRKRPPGCAENDPNEDIMYVSEYEDDDPDDLE